MNRREFIAGATALSATPLPESLPDGLQILFSRPTLLKRGPSGKYDTKVLGPETWSLCTRDKLILNTSEEGPDRLIRLARMGEEWLLERGKRNQDAWEAIKMATPNYRDRIPAERFVIPEDWLAPYRTKPRMELPA
jgi:hypothetical protein